MKIETPTEYLGAVEFLARLNRALDRGLSYMKGDDRELFSKGMERRIGEVTAAIQEYKIKVNLQESCLYSCQVPIVVQGTLPVVGTIVASQGFCLVPVEASVTWGSPARNAEPTKWVGGMERTLTSPCSVSLPA